MKTKEPEAVPSKHPPVETKSSKATKLEWPLEPRVDHWLMTDVLVWETRCGRYQIIKSDDGFAAQRRVGEDKWDIFEYNSKMGAGYPKYYHHLEDALISVETYHVSKHDGSIHTNREEVLVHTNKKKSPGATRIEVERYGKESVKRPRGGDNKMSCLDAAERVLREEDRPLSSKEMIDLMASRGYWSSPKGRTPWQTLASGIGVAIRNGDKRFRAEGKGTFSLNK